LPGGFDGLPRDLYTRLPAKTVARLRVVFCLPATTETGAKHHTHEHDSQAFNALLAGPTEQSKLVVSLRSKP
tara:strand:+ start:614 stop:829 length:216 start_codon:yes stop_codon:yes gene_type:complete